MVSIAREACEGSVELLLGNEAIARGALEAGVKVCAAYPGTPSSEIMETLLGLAKGRNIHVEWSTNEKVAVETVAAASFAGLRAISPMKNAGLNVAMDALMYLNWIETVGGLVMVVCDPVEGFPIHEEHDSRPIAKWGSVALLEPATVQEAKDITKWAFKVSEQVGRYCLVRSVTRLSHTRGNVILGQVPSEEKKAYLDTSKTFVRFPALPSQPQTYKKLEKTQEIFESSPFNWYSGPESPELIIVTAGSGWLCSFEALKILGLEEKVGILKLSTLWPLPVKFLENYLGQAQKILVIEEGEPFIEDNLKIFSQNLKTKLKPKVIYGKDSGHINLVSELSTDEVITALTNILSVPYQARDAAYNEKAQKIIESGFLVDRDFTYCAGCPHRATFWAVKNALKLDNHDGFLCSDVGCYGMEALRGSGRLAKTFLGMGGGIGIAGGFGKLKKFGFTQSAIASCGDSTFYHAAIPALINAKYNQSKCVMVILDNSATGMTGFQPHPGTGKNARGDHAPVVNIEAICRAIADRVEVTDPFDISGTTHKLLKLLEGDGTSVLIAQRKCELIRAREERTQPYRVFVDANKCRGDKCGCANYCIRLFKCPGLIWDGESGKAKIDEAICSGCGVCSDICPHLAIVKENIDYAKC